MQWLRAENEELSAAGGTAIPLHCSFHRLGSSGRSGGYLRNWLQSSFCGSRYWRRVGDDRLFVLYRKIINAETTFNDLMGVGNQEDLMSWGNWSSGGGAVGGPDISSINSDDYLVSNIASFEIKFHVEDDGV